MRATITSDTINAFKATWPCHGFPDELACIHAEWDEGGDLVDFEAYGWQGDALEGFDGPALCALLDDAKARLEAGLWFAVGFYELDRCYGGGEEG